MRKLVTAFAIAMLGIAEANAVIAQQRQTRLRRCLRPVALSLRLGSSGTAMLARRRKTLSL